MTPSNTQRAERLAKVFEAIDHLYDVESPTDAMVDLLTDARHWCDLTGASFAVLDRTACGHYCAEVYEAAIGAEARP